MLTHVNLGSFS